MVMVGIVIFLVSLTAVCSVVAAPEQCSDRVFRGETEVDVKIPVVLGLRGLQCKEWTLHGLKQAIALTWATSLLNGANSSGNASYVPGVKFGVDIYDNCHMVDLTSQHAGYLTSLVRRTPACYRNGTNTTHAQASIAGVIGTNSSPTTTFLADILTSSQLPVMGVSATLPELGDKDKYPNFFRSVPSDLKQAHTIIELAKLYRWTYLVGVYTTSNYGKEGMAEVQRLARAESICFSHIEAIDATRDPSRSEMENFVRDTLLDKIKKARTILGVVYFGYGSKLLHLLRYIETERGSWSLQRQQDLSKITFIVSDATAPQPEIAEILKKFGSKMIFVRPPRPDINSLEAHFVQFIASPPSWAKGPWIESLTYVVQKDLGCPDYNLRAQSLEGCDLGNKTQFSGYITALLDSVYLIAKTVKGLQQQYCPGDGMCDPLREALDSGILSAMKKLEELKYEEVGEDFAPPELAHRKRHLQKVNGDFRPVDCALYSILTNDGDSFVQIGTYKGDAAHIDPQYSDLVGASECAKTCDECTLVDEIHWTFRSGDVILLGLFSIRWSSDGFGCGNFRNDSMSYVAMLSFLNSIDYLRKTTGIDFGYLVIDDCYNSLTATQKIIQVLSGSQQIVDPDTGQEFDPKDVKVAIGAQSSDVTMAVLQALKALGIPLVSYSATNPGLDNRNTYPYFSRTVSSDSIQAELIRQILEKLQVTYVGAIITDNSYGKGLLSLFRTMAEAKGICVDDPLLMTKDTDETVIEDKLKSYRDKNIQVIVAIVMDSLAIKILESVQQDDTFVFVASEAWGLNNKIISGDRGERARGSLVLGASGTESIDYDFKEYLSQMHPFDSTQDSWLRNFWQAHFKCNLPGGFDNIHAHACQKSSNDEYFSEEDYSELTTAALPVHTTLATIAAGKAIQKLSGSTLSAEQLTEEIRLAELTSSSGVAFRPILDDGNGNGEFVIYNVVSGGTAGGYVYESVGRYANLDLTLPMTGVEFYDVTGNVRNYVNSSCRFQSLCKDVCAEGQSGATDGVTTQLPVDQAQEETDNTTLVVVVIILLVVLLVVVVAFFLFWKRRASRKQESYGGSGLMVYRSASSVHSAHPSYAMPSTTGSIRPSGPPPLPPDRPVGNDVTADGQPQPPFPPGPEVQVSDHGIPTSSCDPPGSNSSSQSIPPPRPHAQAPHVSTNTTTSRHAMQPARYAQSPVLFPDDDAMSIISNGTVYAPTIYSNTVSNMATSRVPSPETQLVFTNVNKAYPVQLSPGGVQSPNGSFFPPSPQYYLVRQDDGTFVRCKYVPGPPHNEVLMPQAVPEPNKFLMQYPHNANVQFGNIDNMNDAVFIDNRSLYNMQGNVGILDNNLGTTGAFSHTGAHRVQASPHTGVRTVPASLHPHMTSPVLHPTPHTRGGFFQNTYITPINQSDSGGDDNDGDPIYLTPIDPRIFDGQAETSQLAGAGGVASMPDHKHDVNPHLHRPPECYGQLDAESNTDSGHGASTSNLASSESDGKNCELPSNTQCGDNNNNIPDTSTAPDDLKNNLSISSTVSEQYGQLTEDSNSRQNTNITSSLENTPESSDDNSQTVDNNKVRPPSPLNKTELDESHRHPKISNIRASKSPRISNIEEEIFTI